jgi:hypothetical protein
MEKKTAKRKTTKNSKSKVTASRNNKNKNTLEGIQQTNGKVYEYDVKQVRKLEEILETKKTNPFGTSDARVFNENLAGMNLSDMQEIAVRCGVFPNGNKTILRNKLIKAFKAEGFGNMANVVRSDKRVELDPNNKSHKEIIDYLNS